MKTTTSSSLLLAILVIAALLVSSADAFSGRRSTPAWNAADRRKFGARRSNKRSRSKPTLMTEHASVDDVLEVIGEESQAPPTSTAEQSAKIVPSTARAAAVACVSAAAIGGARHALELIAS